MTRVKRDITQELLQKALDNEPHPSPRYPTYKDSWNGHVKQISAKIGASVKCIGALAWQVRRGMCNCCLNGPEDLDPLNRHLEEMRKKVDGLELPIVYSPPPVQMPVPTPGPVPSPGPSVDPGKVGVGDGVVVIAAVLVFADGPLPIGDAAAACLVGAAAKASVPCTSRGCNVVQ